MEPNKSKVKIINKNESNKKKIIKIIKDNKILKNIDNNTSYESSDTDSNSSHKINSNSNLLIEKKETEEKIEKENNINNKNKNNIAPFQKLNLNQGIPTQSNLNTLNHSQGLNLNSNIQERFSLAKVAKINEEPKIGKRDFNTNNFNPNIVNNNINRIPMLKNNIYQNNNNNFYQYPLYNLNRNQPLNNNNNNLFLNQNIYPSNNLMPRPTNYTKFIPLRNEMNFYNYNQKGIVNNDQPRLTNVQINNRYSLDKNTNLEKERLTNRSNLPNRESNYFKLQDNNFINKPRNTFNPNLNINVNKNQAPQPKVMNIDNLNYFLINQKIPNTSTNIPNYPQAKQFQPSNNQLMNQTNDQVFNANTITNNQDNFQATIPQSKKNDYLNLTLEDYLNQLTNDQVNQQQNLKDNQTLNNYLNQSNSNHYDTNQVQQFFDNYNQPKNAIFEEVFSLRDYGALSRPGKDDTGMTKTNQDSYILKININGINGFNIFGVLDGHGSDGHYVSEFASEFIPNYIINNPEISMNSNTESIYNKLKENNYKIIKQAFIMSDKQLKQVNFDAEESGTTCVLVIHIGKHLICANVGDSRALVAYDERNDPNLRYLRAFPLSVDYKPEIPEEKARIIMSGGVVEQLTNDYGEGVGPYRVFAPGKDYPGLAMSRSIGDLASKKLGVIPEPGIIDYSINKNTRFVVLCSDGVWEFLSNDTVRDTGRQFYLNSKASELCQELISRSVIEWKTNDSIIDDITAIAVFFK